MTDDIFKGVDKDKLQKDLQLLRNSLGPEAAEKIDSALADTERLKALTSKLSQRDRDKAVALLNNPTAVKALLSSPKVADIIKQFMKGE